MKNILFTLTSLITLLVIGVVFMNYAENPKSSFQNYDELVASGVFTEGWVPGYIPKSATDIREQHNLDTNEVNVTFRFILKDSDELNKKCTLLVDNKNGKKYICPPFIGKTSVLMLRNNGVGYYNSTYDSLNY